MNRQKDGGSKNKQQDSERPIPDHIPLRRPMAMEMAVELVVNQNAQVWVLHDKPFPAILHWAEYDQESKALSLITHDGRVQDLGMVIPDEIGDIMMDAGELCAMYMRDGQIADVGIIPVMVREKVFH